MFKPKKEKFKNKKFENIGGHEDVIEELRFALELPLKFKEEKFMK